MPADTLHALLDGSQHLAAEYGGSLSNHLPMALHALHALGAGDSRLREFAGTYATRLAPRPAAGAEVLADWREQRGRIEAFDELRATFVGLLQLQGSEAVLRQTLPDLLPGLGGAAFHGLIRTGHAVQAGHGGELASGLAYWAARWLPLTLPPAAGPALDVATWTARLQREAPPAHPGPNLISLRMQAAQESPTYPALAGRLAMEPDTLQRLTAWAAAVYAASGNFTVLHLVTGCRALRVLQPWLNPTPENHAAVAAAVTAAVLAARIQPGELPPPDAPADWAGVVAVAIAADDEHVIKLVHACAELAAIDGRRSYLQAARRAVA